MKKWILAGAVLLATVGCAPPAATIMLHQQGLKGLEMAKADINDLSSKLAAQYAKQDASLDTAFDADVRACEAGLIKDKDGKPVPLSAAWVIESRKLYAQAKSIIAANQADLQAAKNIRLDNISAAQRALQNAITLIVMQQNLDQNMKGWVFDTIQKSALKGGQ